MTSHASNSNGNRNNSYQSIDTPDGSWSQYCCSTPGCKHKKRVSIAPSMAPRWIRRGCPWCERRVRFRADGGSGLIDMLDASRDDVPPARALGALRGGTPVRTPVKAKAKAGTEVDADTDETKAKAKAGTDSSLHYEYLKPGDEACSAPECGRPIDPEEFGAAPILRLLVNQKRRYGETYCEGCGSKKSEGSL